MSARADLMSDADWYRQAAVYQIYPRSFADANGDGLGDLAGITSRVDYLAGLGIDAVWLSPFYPSALADGGYDVDDYRDVDPRLGTLADFDAMAAALHARGIAVIVDIVPNHSGSGHAWFQAALAAGRGSAERERYIFREGLGEQGELPPTDWTAAFGGSAWERVEDGQWYLHMFDVAQPDWNWDNPEVLAEFEKTLRFWADRGVDGFRVDVAHLLKKDLSEPLPSQAELDAHNRELGNGVLEDRDTVHDVYKAWRRVFNEYEPPRVAVAEAWVPANRRAAYATAQELGQAFNFDLLKATWDAAEFKSIIEFNLQLAGQVNSSSTWVLSNHDTVRHATRYGLPQELADGYRHVLTDGLDPACDVELGLRRARAGTLVTMALPGSVYLYQGEELGLREVVDIPDDQRQDPTFFRSPGVQKGRDGARVPIPWTRDGVSFGFGDAQPHLPQPAWFGEQSVEAQDADPSSTLSLYRTALALRHELQGAETLEWVADGEGVLHFARPGGWHCVTNVSSDEPVVLPSGEVLLTSAPLADDGRLPRDTTAWVRA